MANEQESSDVSNDTPVSKSPPSWIEASLFEPIFRELCTDFKQTKAFEVKQAVGAGENYGTIMLRLIADVELNDGSSESLSLMLKTAHEAELFHVMMQHHNVFQVETDMYNEVVPEFEQIYKEAGLDDLCRKGFKNMNRLEGLDIEHTHAVLRKMAQWHAASAVRVATKGFYKPTLHQGFFKEGVRPMLEGMFDGVVKMFLNCAKSYEGNEIYYEDLCKSQSKIIAEMFENNIDDDEFAVLNHGDLWSNNVMFQHDDNEKLTETYLVDFQMPNYGTPAKDLYYFLLSSTAYELKINQFDHFIKYYHDHLVDNLKLLNYAKKIPTLKELHIMLFKYGVWGFSTATGVMAGTLLDPTEIATVENMMSENDIGMQFKMQLFLNPRYRKHIEMVLPWLHNRGAF